MNDTETGGGATGESSRRGAGGSGRHKRPLILAIEDNPHDWEIYGKILWYNGFDVIHAADGEEGLELARRLLPDMVLLDLIMPKLDGLDVCRVLKSDSLTAGIPIVVLSSRERQRWESPARDAGCAEYLEKPIGPVEVLHTVEQLVGRAAPAGQGRPPRQWEAEDLMNADVLT